MSKATFALFMLLTIGAFSPAYGEPLLNGVAIHVELGKEQFIGGLYASELSSKANRILLAQQSKRIQVRVLATRFSSRRFRRMWIEGMAINASHSELEKHAKNMANFGNMLKVKLVHGDIFTVERSEDDVKISLNSVTLGEIDDVAFFDLLLRTWIGPVPLSSNFRQALLVAGKIPPEPLSIFESTRPSDERIASIESAIKAKRAREESEDGINTPILGKPSLAPPQIAPPIAAAPISIALPTIDQPTPETPAEVETDPEAQTPEQTQAQASPEVTTPPVALLESEAPLDEDIFDDDEVELTAESLLVESLYYSKLVRWTLPFTDYPNRAKSKGQEGVVRLNVTINRKGRVKEIVILDKAEYNSMNREAKKAVRRASPFPKMPEEVLGDEYQFTFRINFKLQ